LTNQIAISSSIDTDLYFDKEILQMTDVNTIKLSFYFLSSCTEY